MSDCCPLGYFLILSCAGSVLKLFYPQAILKSKAYLQKDIEQPSVEKALKNLKSPVTSFGKFLLRKWIVPKARHAVGQREWGKVL